jgi:hypothetical protein
MKRRRHTPKHIIRRLREADRVLAKGHEIPKVAKQLEISEATYTVGGPSNCGTPRTQSVKASDRLGRSGRVEGGTSIQLTSELAAKRTADIILRHEYPYMQGAFCYMHRAIAFSGVSVMTLLMCSRWGSCV